MLPLATASEAPDNSNQTYDSDATSTIGIPISAAALDALGRRPQEQEADTVYELPHIAPGNRPSAYNRLVLDTWICESIAIAFSIGCVVAIAITVGSYEDGPIPDLPSGVTLNAMISILSTAARSALIFVVSAAIGQLKWCWFIRSGRRLQDVQTMDEASRGPLGACRILATWTGGSLANLGAFITICMIAFGPFFQQLVEYPSRNVEQLDLTAVAPRNTNFTTRDSQAVDSVIAAGLVFRSEVLNQSPSCPTANCSWDEYKSVGWCSKCRRIDGYLLQSECSVKARLDLQAWEGKFCGLWAQSSNGSYALDQQHLLNLLNLSEQAIHIYPDQDHTSKVLESIREILYPGPDYNNTVADNGPKISNPIPIFGFRHATFDRDEETFQNLIHNNQAPLRLDQLNECVLELCERGYKVETINGNTSSYLTSTNYGEFFSLDEVPSEHRSPRTLVDPPLCWHPGGPLADLRLTSRDDGYTYQDESKSAFCPSRFLHYKERIGGIIVSNYTSTWFFNRTYASDDRMEWDPSLMIFGTPREPEWSPSNFNSTIEGIAAALTSFGLSTSNHNVTGKAFLSLPYVRVRWQWIALPAFLELASFVLFLSTVVYSRFIGAPIWKSSLLAVYYHEVEDLHERGRVSLLSEMDKVSSTTSVRFFSRQDNPGTSMRRVTIARQHDD